MTVKQAADEIMASGRTMARDLDEICDMVRGMAAGMEQPEADWFMADVLNEVNGREMALEL